MYLSEEQYQKIARLLPRQRGNVDIENRRLLEGLVFRCKTGCAWSGAFRQMAHRLYPPKAQGKKRGFGTGICRLGGRGAKGIACFRAGFGGGQGASGLPRGGKKNGEQAIGKTRGGWNTTSLRPATPSLPASDGNEADAPAGRLLLETLDPRETTVDLAMDRAYSDDLTRMTAWLLKYNPIVPPKRNRKSPWVHNAELYKKRNEVERFFRRLKTYRAVATRYDKLDLVFSALIWLACICNVSSMKN